jgi:hypothetical protein
MENPMNLRIFIVPIANHMDYRMWNNWKLDTKNGHFSIELVINFLVIMDIYD